MEKVTDTGVLFFYCLIVFYLSAQPKVPIQSFFPHQDKLMHGLGYFMMGLLAWRAFRHFIGNSSWLTVCCVGFCGLYGLSDEIHQHSVPGRSADPYDLIADVVGGALALGLIRVVKPAFAISCSVRSAASPPGRDRKS